MNRSNEGGHSARVREAVSELVHHNDERTHEQRDQYMLMASFVAGMCVAGSGNKALAWPSACGQGFPGLLNSAYAVISKLSCNVSVYLLLIVYLMYCSVAALLLVLGGSTSLV